MMPTSFYRDIPLPVFIPDIKTLNSRIRGHKHKQLHQESVSCLKNNFNKFSKQNIVVASSFSSDENILIQGSKQSFLSIGLENHPFVLISNFLNSRQEEHQRVDELHIIAHGNHEGIELGGQFIDASELEKHKDKLKNWCLQRIVLWSCFVGSNSKWIQKLEQSTGAEVYASEEIIDKEHCWTKNNKNKRYKQLSEIIDSKVLSNWEGHLSWEKVGDDIDGEAASDYSGSSVSLSSDGSIVAIGADNTIVADSGPLRGHVRIYQKVSGSWTQIGENIYGEAFSDESGYSVSLSSDGSIVAIGAPSNDGTDRFNGVDGKIFNIGHVRIYQNVSGTWTQIGDDINGEAAGDVSGRSVSLSSDGSIVAIGADFNDGNGLNSGHVRIYQNVNETWTQIGDDIDGEAIFDLSGYSVSLSSDGSVVAIGADNNNGNGSASGHVRIYQNVSGTWTQIGDDIDGEAASDASGTSVSLSSDGSVVAIGARGNGSGSGHVRIYQNVSGTWTQIGDDIDGEAANDQSGTSVSLSSDGSVVAIGAPYNDGNGSGSGHVRIYQNVSGTWTQIGDDIDGEVASDASGTSVSLSSDGSIVAIGAPSNDGNGNNSGHTRVFTIDLNPTLSSSTPSDDATAVAVDSNIILDFSEAVDVETGNFIIKKTSDNATVETIDVTGDQVTGSGTTQITINPANDFDSETDYYVQIPATAFDDASGNSYAGITNTTTLSFTTDEMIDPLTGQQTFNLDVDGDGSVTALGDGLMVIRKLFGAAFAGDALTSKALSIDATRTTDEIHEFIQAGMDEKMLDVDGDGSVTALGDGLMVIRKLFGAAFAGEALTDKALSNNATRTTDEIHEYIAAMSTVDTIA